MSIVIDFANALHEKQLDAATLAGDVAVKAVGLVNEQVGQFSYVPAFTLPVLPVLPELPALPDLPALPELPDAMRVAGAPVFAVFGTPQEYLDQLVKQRDDWAELAASFVARFQDVLSPVTGDERFVAAEIAAVVTQVSEAVEVADEASDEASDAVDSDEDSADEATQEVPVAKRAAARRPAAKKA